MDIACKDNFLDDLGKPTSRQSDWHNQCIAAAASFKEPITGYISNT